jgi:enoyl-CoA hydratase
MEVMLLGTKVGAQRAYDVGFINRVTENGGHEAEAIAMAQELVNAAPLVVATLKHFVNDIIMPAGPVERMVAVSNQLAAVRNSTDLKEGVAAYKEKRAPRFTGS